MCAVCGEAKRGFRLGRGGNTLSTKRMRDRGRRWSQHQGTCDGGATTMRLATMQAPDGEGMGERWAGQQRND